VDEASFVIILPRVGPDFI